MGLSPFIPVGCIWIKNPRATILLFHFTHVTDCLGYGLFALLNFLLAEHWSCNDLWWLVEGFSFFKEGEGIGVFIHSLHENEARKNQPFRVIDGGNDEVRKEQSRDDWH